MKYLYIILLGVLALVPATYAAGTNNADVMARAQAEDITVTGKIIDDTGEALPGATVTQKGTTNGTITDIDGNFTLTVPSDATVVVSFIGFKSTEVIVGGRSVLGNITLGIDLTELDEVIVVGYGTQRKVDLTGSVAIVDTEEMKKVSNSNISTMLQGRVAGVQITSDGQPGADPAVRIRGMGSFGNTSPLYVVDGVIMGTTIRDFSPNDIESVQVLKDASAAAIYGARSANGVVIITTKSGKKDQPMRIDYSGYIGFDQVQKDVYDVMDAEQYGQHLTDVFGNSGLDVPSGYNPNSENYLYNADGTAKVNTNWYDEVFKTGIRQNHNINLSGGGENNTYNVAMDYFTQEGTMEGAGPNFDRYTARFKNSMDVKFIKFNTNVVYSHSDQDNMALSNANEYVEGLYGSQFPVMASALITPPTIKAYDESTWVLDGTLSPASEYQYDSYGYGTYYDDIHGDLRVTNVLLTNNLLERNSTVDRIVASGSANVDFLEMLNAESGKHKLSYNLNLSYSKTHVKDFTFVPAFIQSTTNYLTKSNETLTEEHRSYTESLIENTINYDGQFGRHHVNVLAGQSFQRWDHNRLTGIGNNMTEPYYLQVNNSEQTQSSTYEEVSLMESYFGRINYDFDEKYLFSATVRQDASSRLSPDDNTDIFPAASVGWRIDREGFFPVSESTISLFKIRGSYGEQGNISNLGPYDYMATMARGDYTYSYQNSVVMGSAISSFVNERLLWEKKKTLDIGLDLGLFDDQLEFTFDWYEATAEDLHYDVAVPAQAGFTNAAVKMNAATMVNSGMEFLLAYHNYNNEVKFDVSANFSTLTNEVTKLGVLNAPRTDGTARTEVGREIGSFYGYVYEGIFQSQDEIDNRVNSEGNFIDQPGAQPGDVAYADIAGAFDAEGNPIPDGQITNEDQTYLGSGLPKYSFGLNARVEWKGLDLSVMAFGAAGFKAVDFVDVTLRSSYGALNKSTDLLNAWTPENTNTDVPRVANRSNGDITNDMFSSRFIQDATYLKIANIQIGYNFPDSWFGDYINNVRIYATGQNLFVFSKYKGYNVDFAGGTFTPGYNYASYPTPRTVMGGVQFSF
ncbi:SusC/RagA family TonB-linked outer membrane protein [Reichenbachiella agariperforans]|uniref:SusC/RagA family TonB-linked outer membrane protein n=1 Tax=Reichenbachiella agariperforans TaxID=156994 RepID=UPI001C08BA57|nr:TonB-dependent receptor [Reichenbachiella agariperforans]MBU2912384.1 TonB-dependent receptor [Reichenbachiella agariperforans]